MNEEKLREYYAIYTDCWKLFKKFSKPDDSDKFWQALVDESDLILKKHGKSELCKKIIAATQDEIEIIYKRKKKMEEKV